MTIYRYSARAAQYEQGVLFPAVLAGLLGLWALIAMAVACNPKLVAEAENQPAAAYVSCEPAEAGQQGQPGQLLRCTFAPRTTAPRDI
jgi:hypothetical protein